MAGTVIGRRRGVGPIVAQLPIRILGAGALGILGWRLGELFSEAYTGQKQFLPWGLGAALAGAPLGALVAPYLIVSPWRRLIRLLQAIPAAALLGATFGWLLGLVVAALISIPIYSLNGWMSWGLPLILTGTLGLLGLWFGALRRHDVEALFPALAQAAASNAARQAGRRQAILVDTSAIIDGRIADLTSTGFLTGTLMVPRFVLDELRHIADSSDSQRRARGRRGLEILGRLRRDPRVPFEVLDVGLRHGDEVDSSLVELARGMNVPILTTDFNLNRVAELQGVQVLNVNELANAIKSIVLPGEELRVNIVQEGKELGQGVAYLDDGTMIVVEGGRRYLNSQHDVVVTRVLQTAAGRIIFSQPK